MRSVMYIRACAALVIATVVISLTSVIPISPATPVLAQGAGTIAVVPGATSLVVTKMVRDVTTNGAFGTNITASQGDLLQYSITVGNPTMTTANSVVLSDTLTTGQSYATSTTCSPACYFSGATIFFNIGTLPSGAQAAPATFNVYVSANATGTIVADVATATSSLGTVNSQPAYVNVSGAAVVPGGSCVYSPCVPSCTYSPCVATCGYTSCGTPCGFSPCSTPCGYSPCSTPCGFSPCSTPCGTCGTVPSPCSSYCLPTTCTSGCTTPGCATSNCFSFTAGQNMLCGIVTAYTPATGATAGSVTINGMQVSLMPYMVPSGQIVVGQSYCISLVMNNSLTATSAVVSPNLPGINCGCTYSVAGVPACSLLSTTGTVQGSLSLVPTAAKAVDDPTWVHRLTRTTYTS